MPNRKMKLMLVMQTPAKAASKHIRLEAPLKVIRTATSNLMKKGYKLQNSIGLDLRGYATS